MAEKIQRTTIEYRERDCDICGSFDLASLWEYSHEARIVNSIYAWQVQNVICRICGFVFTSPAPTDSSLEKYYGNTPSMFNRQLLDYSIDRRLQLIEKYAKPGTEQCYVEVGSKNCPEFLEGLNELVTSISTVELNEECESDHQQIREVASESAEILTAYFVLEHIPEPGTFLEHCRRIMTAEGVLIIEVPNLYRYPQFTDGLILWEHTNHFSPVSLQNLAGRSGLELQEIDEESCSRPFGFTAVFSKAASGKQQGIAKHREFETRLQAVRENITRQGEQDGTTILWAANNMCRRLLKDFSLPDNAYVLDINERKQELFDPVPVAKPEMMVSELNQCRLLVVNTARHADEICQWIRRHSSNDLSETEIIVLDFS